MSTAVIVSEPNASAALTWAKKNCPSYITNSSSTTLPATPTGLFVIRYNFYFSNEVEALMFRLKWAK